MNRREFLRGAGGLSVPAVIITASSWLAASESEPALSPITAVVFDQRYSDCRRFAGALARYGAELFPTIGDSASVWQNSLRSHMANRRGRLAGFTTYSDFVVLQGCRLQLRLKSLHQGHHDRRAASTLSHRIIGSSAASAIAAAVCNTNADWARSLAMALRLSTQAYDFGREMTITTRTERASDHPGFLVSWMFGPPQSQ